MSEISMTVTPRISRSPSMKPTTSPREDTAEDQRVADFLAQEGGQIAHDMAHHLGDQIFDLMKRHGLAQRSEAGATAMVTIAATILLEQAVDQCSRAAEEDCRGAVVRLFLDQLSEATRGSILSQQQETKRHV